MTTFKISIHSSLEDSNPITVETDLKELVETMTEYDELPAKNLAKCWSPIVYSDDVEPGKNKRRADNAIEVSCLAYDFDAKSGFGPGELERLLSRITNLGYFYILHETYTENSFRLIFPLSESIPANKAQAVWITMSKVLGVFEGFDHSTKDLARLYYGPSKPAGANRRVFVAEKDSVLLSIEGVQSEWQEINTPAGYDLSRLRERVSKSSSKYKQEVSALLDGHMEMRQGDRTQKLHNVISSLAFFTDDKFTDEVLLAVINPTLLAMKGLEEEGLSAWERKVIKSFHDAKEEKKKKDATKPSKASKVPTSEQPLDPNDWRSKLLPIEGKEAKEGNPAKYASVTHNLSLILENDDAFAGHIGFDMLRRRLMVTGGPLHNVNEDVLGIRLQMWLQCSDYNLRMTKTDCESVLLDSALRHTYDPVLDYLRAVKWDGVRRLDNVLNDICGAIGNKDYLQIISRRFFISAVARAMQPGCQVDTVLVLKGPQGARKTSFVRALGGPFFVETKLNIDSKDAIQVATQNWLVELSEMASLRTNYEAVRSFISTREDQIRLPYGRTPGIWPRRCVFVATTNSELPLNDPEGSRRFWLVECGKIKLEEVERLRDQLWAEAVEAFEAGEQWWLSDEEQKVALNENEPYSVQEIEEEVVSDWLDGLKEKPEFISTTTIIVEAFNLQPSSPQGHALVKVIKRVMLKVGYKSFIRREGGRLRRGYLRIPDWVRPEFKQ